MISHEHTCPYCRQRHTMATSVFDPTSAPEDGDVTMCFSCGAWAMFASGYAGGLRRPDKMELALIHKNPDCKAMRLAWLNYA